MLEVLEPSPASLDFLDEQVQTRSYPNVHGDVSVSANAAGARQGVGAAVGILIVGTGGAAAPVLAGIGLAASVVGTVTECADGGKRRNCYQSVLGTVLDAATFGTAPLLGKVGRWIPSAWQGVSLFRDTWGNLTVGNPRNRGCPSFAPSPEMGGGAC